MERNGIIMSRVEVGVRCNEGFKSSWNQEINSNRSSWRKTLRIQRDQPPNESLARGCYESNLGRLMHSWEEKYIQTAGMQASKLHGYSRAITSKFNFKQFKDFHFSQRFELLPLGSQMNHSVWEVSLSRASRKCNLVYHLFSISFTIIAARTHLDLLRLCISHWSC